MARILPRADDHTTSSRPARSAQAVGGAWPAPPCVICGQYKRDTRTQRHLTHGISVWLCTTHAHESFLRQRGGAEFAERLAAVWAATGLTNGRWNDALHAHVRSIRNAGAERDRPGSYSWPKLRKEAERRFATGEDPRAIITDLRQHNADGPAMAPSVRTMRRWYTQARWLDTPPQPQKTHRIPRTIPSRYLRPGVGIMPPGMRQNPIFPWVHPWNDDP